MENLNGSRPKNVGLAVKLLWIAFSLSILLDILIYYFSSSALIITNPILGVYLIPLILYLFLFAFLTYKIGKGKNWARITLLVIFILKFIVFFIDYNSILGAIYLLGFNWINVILKILELGILILQLVAFVFLFKKPSSDWFNSVKK